MTFFTILEELLATNSPKSLDCHLLTIFLYIYIYYLWVLRSPIVTIIFDNEAFHLIVLDMGLGFYWKSIFNGHQICSLELWIYSKQI